MCCWDDTNTKKILNTKDTKYTTGKKIKVKLNVAWNHLFR
jgi:hypothetical protein